MMTTQDTRAARLEHLRKAYVARRTGPSLLGAKLDAELGDDTQPEPEPIHTGWAWALLAALTVITSLLQYVGT